MARAYFPQLCAVSLLLCFFTSYATANSLNGDLKGRSLYDSQYDDLYSWNDTFPGKRQEARISKRGLQTIDIAEAKERQDVEFALHEMMDLVQYVVDRPNDQVLGRYFPRQDWEDVKSIFRTVLSLAKDGSQADPLNPARRPYDLSQIKISRQARSEDPNLQSWAKPLVLADAVQSELIPRNPNDLGIVIYDFGWDVLFKRFMTQDCKDIGPNTNYKMHFLGSLLLHETLHFEGVMYKAWNLQNTQEHKLDDLPGTFPCFQKAFGAYEAMQLLARNPASAKYNIENYVWYALEVFWLNRCPPKAPATMFIAPQNNDIPTSCKLVGAKQELKNLWCWIS